MTVYVAEVGEEYARNCKTRVFTTKEAALTWTKAALIADKWTGDVGVVWETDVLDSPDEEVREVEIAVISGWQLRKELLGDWYVE